MSERARRVCRLRFEGQGPSEGRVYTLGDRAVVLGRSPLCDLVIEHDSVSREHACFRRVGDDWSIDDLGSKNGVRVNTFRVKEQTLRDGDRIDLGDARLYVEIRPARESLSTPASVVFSEHQGEGQHTEIFEMSGIRSLLPNDAGGRGPAAAGYPASATARQRHDEAPFDAGAAVLLQLVSAAAEALISCDSLDETLDRILALVFDNLPAERGVICLHDETTGSTEPKVMRTREGVAERPILISSHIAQHVVEKKQALLVRDTLVDDRFGGAQSVIMMRIHSAICAPLYREGRVAGFIYADRQSEREPFQSAHLQELSALAMLSAVAVEQAALRDRIRHEQELRARLARYSSPAVVERILRASGSAEAGMVAEEGEVSVLFADLKGFTGMAERMPSAEVIAMLNGVFARLTEVVFQLEGTLDKFRGDGMMAFFGAPLPLPDHAERAVEAALRMQAQLAELNARSGRQRVLRMRIGINSGSVVVGDIGSPQRKDYTVIGDTVNIASRLESSVAEPGQVVISRPTFEQVRARFRCRPLDAVQVKGKRESVEPYLVLGRLDRKSG